MLKALIIAAALVWVPALAADDASQHTIDLEDAVALAQLKVANPAHYEKIRQILIGLQEEPKRAEGDWLQANFNASDVDLSRYLLKTSNPPKQRLQFTLDDVRYKMQLTRPDLTATFIPVK
jgi:hypothetical protein